MSQEALMIAVDNSSYMTNGDFIPDRFYAQKEAVNFLCNSKRRQNPENTFGLLTLCNCEVLCTLTSDPGKLHSKLASLYPDGETKFCNCISIAHLVLRNRMSRSQKPRILVFLGSPVEDHDDEIQKLAKRLKKEKVGVTIISFGETEFNDKKLSKFIEILNGKDETNQLGSMLTVPSGCGIQEYLRLSPIIVVDNNQMAGGGLGFNQGGIGSGTSGFMDGSDDDPDLAYALRISMEEQRMRQVQNTPVQAKNEVPETIAEESMLNQAINTQMSVPQSVSDSNIPLEAMTEEEQIAFALNMSMNTHEEPSKNESKESITSVPIKKGDVSAPKIRKKDSEIQ